MNVPTFELYPGPKITYSIPVLFCPSHKKEALNLTSCSVSSVVKSYSVSSNSVPVGTISLRSDMMRESESLRVHTNWFTITQLDHDDGRGNPVGSKHEGYLLLNELSLLREFIPWSCCDIFL